MEFSGVFQGKEISRKLETMDGVRVSRLHVGSFYLLKPGIPGLSGKSDRDLPGKAWLTRL